MFQRLTPSAFSWRRRSAGSNCQASVPAAAASAEAARLTAFDNGCAALHGEVRIAGGIDKNGGVNPDESAFGGYEDRLNGIVFRFAGDKRGVEHQLHTGFFAGFQKHIFQNMGRGDAVGGSLCAPCRAAAMAAAQPATPPPITTVSKVIPFSILSVATVFTGISTFADFIRIGA